MKHWLFKDLPSKKNVQVTGEFKVMGLSVTASLIATTIWFIFGPKVAASATVRRLRLKR